MNVFRTEVNPRPFDQKIGLGEKIFSIGSCFAENIGNKFAESKQSILVNPFGIIYNPLSVCSLINKSLEDRTFDKEGYINKDGVWYHTEMHSRVTAVSREILEKMINEISVATKKSISACQWILITLGTAVIYETLDNNRLVANCHKIPANNFNKRILKSAEIVEALEATIKLIKSINPSVKLVFTVSPVRHIKDTIFVNTISKSTLLIAIHELIERHKGVYYFPAFEIMMDDLRDYRFYSDDMLHPSKMAQEYIWNKLVESSFSDELISFIRKWDKINKSLSHRPFNSNSQKHQSFLKKLLQELENLNSKVDVKNEIKDVKAQII